MSLHEVCLDRNAIDVASSSNGTYLATLDQVQVTVFAYDDQISTFSREAHLNLPSSFPERNFPRQIVFQGNSNVMILAQSEDSHRDVIYKASIEGGNASLVAVLQLLFAAACLLPGSNYNSIFIESTSGFLYEIEDSESAPSNTKGISIAELQESALSVKEILKNPPWQRPCPRIEVWESGERVRDLPKFWIHPMLSFAYG